MWINAVFLKKIYSKNFLNLLHFKNYKPYKTLLKVKIKIDPKNKKIILINEVLLKI